jgi:hypothetical protein
MEIRITPAGGIRCLYDEALDLTSLGPLTIERASHVEPDITGQWMADLSPVGGPRLGPFARRSDALAAESAWLGVHWLPSSAHSVAPLKTPSPLLSGDRTQRNAQSPLAPSGGDRAGHARG